jgi:hypothetical protein
VGERKISATVIVAIGSLSPISVEGVIRGGDGASATKSQSSLISSHMDVHSARPSVGQHQGGCTYKCMYIRNEHPYVKR